MELITKKNMLIAQMQLGKKTLVLGSISPHISLETLESFKADMLLLCQTLSFQPAINTGNNETITPTTVTRKTSYRVVPAIELPAGGEPESYGDKAIAAAKVSDSESTTKVTKTDSDALVTQMRGSRKSSVKLLHTKTPLLSPQHYDGKIAKETTSLTDVPTFTKPTLRPINNTTQLEFTKDIELNAELLALGKKPLTKTDAKIKICLSDSPLNRTIYVTIDGERTQCITLELNELVSKGPMVTNIIALYIQTTLNRITKVWDEISQSQMNAIAKVIQQFIVTIEKPVVSDLEYWSNILIDSKTQQLTCVRIKKYGRGGQWIFLNSEGEETGRLKIDTSHLTTQIGDIVKRIKKRYEIVDKDFVVAGLIAGRLQLQLLQAKITAK
jgi:hypothetical protein